jgi:hypothetical protein
VTRPGELHTAGVHNIWMSSKGREGYSMKLDRLKKSVGWLMEIVPPACHLDDQGNSLPEKNEEWLVEEVTDDLVRLSEQSGHQVKLGTDHIYSFATNPQRAAGNVGFLSLHVQVFVQGGRVFEKPNARPGERVPPNPTVIGEKIVKLNYGQRWLSTCIALAVILLGIGAPAYRYLSPPRLAPTAAPFDYARADFEHRGGDSIWLSNSYWGAGSEWHPTIIHR